MEHHYKLLSRVSKCGDSTHVVTAGLSCTSRGENCPAIVEHGDDLLIIGRVLTAKERRELLKHGPVSIGPGEQVVAITRKLLTVAARGMKESIA